MLFPSNVHKALDEDFEIVGCNPDCSEESISIADYYNAIWNTSTASAFLEGKPIRNNPKRRRNFIHPQWYDS